MGELNEALNEAGCSSAPLCSRAPERGGAPLPYREHHAEHDGIRVLVSSDDGAPVPHIRGAKRLADVATDHGWSVRLTYALACVPPETYADPKRTGLVKKPGHALHSVAVRMGRGSEYAAAVWERVDEGPWEFTHAVHRPMGKFTYNLTPMGVRELTKRVSQA